MALDDALGLVQRSEVVDAKSIIGLTLAKLHLEAATPA